MRQRTDRLLGLLAVLILVAFMACVTGCGGSSTPTPQAPHEPPRSLHTGRVLLVGGNALMDWDGARYVPHDYGPCVRNEGVPRADSTTFAGVFNLGVLNEYPRAIYIVADAFELTYMERWRTLDNLTSATQTATVSGAPVTLVGVPGADGFNEELKALARAYGASYAATLAVPGCAS